MRKWIVCILAGLILLGIGGKLFVDMAYSGAILLNNPSDKKYPVKGVDVSLYQGNIDWAVLETQNIKFAFIKATEGSGYVDPKFAYNYEQAQKTKLRVGAYHYFSYDSSGKTQAELFISTVPKIENMLPPVIDVEFYGDKEINLPDIAIVRSELNVMIEELQNHYGCTPIIYAVKKTYDLFIADSFPDCDIWIRDVILTPKLSDGRTWTFWQYTNKKKLDGYSGEERFIDMNVFSGTESEFEKYPK